MKTEKNAKELGQLLCGLIDDVLDPKCKNETLARAGTISGLTCQLLRQAALEIAYARANKTVPPRIPILTRE